MEKRSCLRSILLAAAFAAPVILSGYAADARSIGSAYGTYGTGASISIPTSNMGLLAQDSASVGHGGHSSNAVGAGRGTRNGSSRGSGLGDSGSDAWTYPGAGTGFGIGSGSNDCGCGARQNF